MRTTSLMVQNLCVPCGCRCRYCLLSWDGEIVGVPWEAGVEFARKFIAEAKAARPELNFSFSFGYCMEHPRLPEAIHLLREIGSPQAGFLQCDGLRIRDEEGCARFCAMLAEEDVKELNFTFYGLLAYHDRFAGRKGDFEFLLRLMRAASRAGLKISAGIPLTKENIDQTEELIGVLRGARCDSIRLFIPHEEGRGKALAPLRLEADDLRRLSPGSCALLSEKVYKTESAWITGNTYEEETERSLILSLRRDNLERLRTMRAQAVIEEIECLDERYYAAFPTFAELAREYGDPRGAKLYRQRDLFYHYRQRYARDHRIDVYDVCDERQSGSRRYGHI